MRGLGRLSDVLAQALFPVPQELGLDERTKNALQKQSLMQLGLGMMGAKDRGAGLGQGLNMAYQQAQQGLGQGVQQSFIAKRSQREDQRLDMQDRRISNAELQQDQDRTQSRIDMERNRLERKQQFEANQANVRADNQRSDQQFSALRSDRAADNARQDAALKEAERRRIDTERKNANRFTSQVRKEFRALPSVKSYEEVLPVIQSAKKAPDTGYGDLQLIYSVGKTLDPGSVVREGELALTVQAGSPLQRILGTTRFSIEEGGRLTPQLRSQIMDMLNQRVGSYQQAYEKDRAQYERYAVENDTDPFAVVGDHALSAYGPQPSAAAPTDSAAQQLDSLMGRYGGQP